MLASVIELINGSSKDPGVYLFKDVDGQVIYVGKAKNLRERLKSYIKAESVKHLSRSLDIKLQSLVSKIKGLETIISSTETEALILESQLIKKYKPRYNIQLKDDKNYPYIKIDLKKDWPRFEIARRFKTDGALYFGPYTSTRYIKQLSSVINEVFLLRKCNDVVFKTAKRPCINYDMHNCLAPCQEYISKENYLGIVGGVIDLLKGRVRKLIENMKKEMILASDNMDFEEAARIREKIKILEVLSSKQGIINPNDARDIDVITYKLSSKSHYFNIAVLRAGILIGMSNVEFIGEGTKEQALARFIADHYVKNVVPDLIIQPFDLYEEGLSTFLKKRRQEGGHKNFILTKKSTRHIKSLRFMAEKNLDDFINKKLAIKSRWVKLSEELSKVLSDDLNDIETAECYDISNISGQHTVGAKVFFDRGLAIKDNYRRYKIKGEYRGDDLSAMKEVLERRLLNLAEEPLPDLILIDGGKTQLNAVQDVFLKLGLTKPSLLASIAKDKTRPKGLSQDKIYRVKKSGSIEPVVLSMEALNLMKMIRDEAHRFAISYNRKSRKNF